MIANPEFSILLVDDEAAWLRSLQLMLARTLGYTNVLTCQDATRVPDLLAAGDIGLVLLDLTMPKIRGDELLRLIREQYPDVLVIIITGLNNVDEAVKCMKNGAFDYYVKTWGEERLTTGIKHAVRVAELERENRRARQSLLSDDLRNPEAFAEIVTAAQSMRDIFHYVEAVSKSRHTILITGESGVGKELIARAIHKVSGAGGKFISVNMASLDGQMLEDTLFGHTKGAFTNAQSQRDGLVEQARGGTLFLDEIGELSPESQARLLRFLQEGEYYPLGSDKSKKVETRIVVATNQNLLSSQEQGRFRSDLYYRLSTHHIHIPPLRERREDISLLAQYFIEKAAADFHRPAPTLPNDLALALARYNFPGNVRELQGMITHAVSIAKGDSLSPADFNQESLFSTENNQAMQDENSLLQLFLSMDPMPSFAEIKKLMTMAALTRSGGNQTVAAKILGISQPALSKRLHA